MGEQHIKIFISYNRQNQTMVRSIDQQLRTVGFDTTLELFFDEENIMPGDQWLKEIERALTESQACLVFIGPQGVGHWQNKEALKAINRCINSDGTFKIIPVMLPDETRKLEKNLPWFLADYQWVEFTDTVDPFAFSQLVKGIRKEENTTTILQQGQNPYKGLDYFEVNDAPFFFGRTLDLNWVFYKKLRLSARTFTDRFLAIVGDSGSGKSSFVRAGILAALRADRYRDSSQWKHIIANPADRPLLKLSTALMGEGIIKDSESFDNRALEDNDCLRRAVETHNEKIVLFIDQFEEMITQCKDEKERQAYLNNLTAAVKSGKLLLLVTLRSDFYGSFSRYKTFADLLESNNYTLSGLDFAEGNEDWERYVKDIIEKPAQLEGVRVAKELTEHIINELKVVNGVLPILQMSLDKLWGADREDPSMLSLKDFISLSSNKGIGGIIEKKAQDVFDTYSANDVVQRKAGLLKAIFIRLVEVTDVKEDVRKIIKKDDLVSQLTTQSYTEEEVNEALLFLSSEHARLLRMRRDNQIEVSVELVHEVLIRRWGSLRGWVNERRMALHFKSVLERDISEWKDKKKDPDYLYSRKKHRATEKWLLENPDLITDDIKNFIEEGKKQLRKKIIYLIIYIVVGFVGFVILLLLSLYFILILMFSQ